MHKYVFKTDDEETNMRNQLSMFNLPKDEDADGLREYCSGVPKLTEYGALFALKLLFIFKFKTK